MHDVAAGPVQAGELHLDPASPERVRRDAVVPEVLHVQVPNTLAVRLIGDVVVAPDVALTQTEGAGDGAFVGQREVPHAQLQRDARRPVLGLQGDRALVLPGWGFLRDLDGDPEGLILVCLQVNWLVQRRQRIRPPTHTPGLVRRALDEVIPHVAEINIVCAELGAVWPGEVRRLGGEAVEVPLRPQHDLRRLELVARRRQLDWLGLSNGRSSFPTYLVGPLAPPQVATVIRP